MTSQAHRARTIGAISGAAALALLAAGAASPATAASRASTPPECTAHDVSVSYKATDAGMSHVYGVLTITNVSADACHTGGVGSVSYVNSRHREFGAPAGYGPGTWTSIVLKHGESATQQISITDVRGVYSKRQCRPEPAIGLDVYVPRSHTPNFVALAGTGCANTAIQDLNIEPYVKA